MYVFMLLIVDHSIVSFDKHHFVSREIIQWRDIFPWKIHDFVGYTCYLKLVIKSLHVPSLLTKRLLTLFLRELMQVGEITYIVVRQSSTLKKRKKKNKIKLGGEGKTTKHHVWPFLFCNKLLNKFRQFHKEYIRIVKFWLKLTVFEKITQKFIFCRFLFKMG